MMAATEAGHGDQPAESPLVSVIIPTWNRAPMLRLAIATVLAQDLAGGDFEVLVIGDACTDESEEVVASFADPRLHWHNLDAELGIGLGADQRRAPAGPRSLHRSPRARRFLVSLASVRAGRRHRADRG